MWSVLLRLLQDEDEQVHHIASQSVDMLTQSPVGKYTLSVHPRTPWDRWSWDPQGQEQDLGVWCSQSIDVLTRSPAGKYTLSVHPRTPWDQWSWDPQGQEHDLGVWCFQSVDVLTQSPAGKYSLSLPTLVHNETSVLEFLKVKNKTLGFDVFSLLICWHSHQPASTLSLSVHPRTLWDRWSWDP